MLRLKDIREYISSLGIAEDEQVYTGKLDNKKLKSIGVYSRKLEGTARIALGGLKNTSYDIKPVSLLIHWNKSQTETEEAAYKLFGMLQEVTNITIGDTFIHFISMMVPEPQGVGTDDSGVYEYAIWVDFIYKKED